MTGTTKENLSVARPASEERHARRYHNRSGACIACRGSKTRCIVLEGQEACQACIKHDRECVAPGPRKPRISSMQRMSELERKIESLQDALAVRDRVDTLSLGSAQGSSSLNKQHILPEEKTVTLSVDINTNHKDHGRTSKHDSDIEPKCPVSSRPSLDVVDQGLIAMAEAILLFNHWKENMQPLFPLVLPHHVATVDFIRSSRPILFLAIITIASASIQPSITMRLSAELNEHLARQILVLGKQSEELTQAALLYSQYYIRPQTSKNLVASQYLSSAIVMSLDLGLDAKGLFRPGSIDSNTSEAARTCLGGYYASSSFAAILNRNRLFPWTTRMESHLDTLKNGSNVHASDQWLCTLIQLQRIIEEASISLDLFDVRPSKELDDPRTKYTLNNLRQQLETWKNSACNLKDDRFLEHGYHIANLFIHRNAIRLYMQRFFPLTHSTKLPEAKASPTPISPLMFDTLCTCVESSKNILEIYLSFNVSLARSLPNLYLFWNMFAIVHLMKMSHFIEYNLTPDTTSSGPMILRYFDALISKIDDISSDGHLPQAIPFGMIFRKLKIWYLHKREICINPHGNCENITGNKVVLDVLEDGAAPDARIMSNKADSSAPTLQPGQQPSIDQSYQQQTLMPMYDSQRHNSPINSTQSSWGTNPHTPSDIDYANNIGDAGLDSLTYVTSDWSNINVGTSEMEDIDAFMLNDESWMGLWM